MDKYAAARIVNALITVLGWATIALAVLFLFGTFGRPSLIGALTVALPVAISGLALIAVAQIASAQLDTAENTHRMANKLDELSRKIPVPPPPAPPGPQMPKPPAQARDPETLSPGESVQAYKGRVIKREASGYSVDGHEFGSIAAAKVWIEAEALRKGAGG